MQFKANVGDLVKAFDTAGKITPSLPRESPSYLFSVQEEGEAYLYSRNESSVVRVPVDVFEISGSGDFLFPMKVPRVFKQASGVIIFDVEEQEDKKQKVIYHREGVSGLSGTRLTENPALVPKFDADLPKDASSVKAYTYNASLLRTALMAVKGYAAKDSTSFAFGNEYFQTIQVFDDSKPEWKDGDGVMYAVDGYRTAHFESPTFKGKPFALGVEHVPAVLSFLANCEGDVTIRSAKNMVFFENSTGYTLGVRHRVKTHPKYSYYSLDQDTLVLSFDRSLILRAIKQIHAEMSDGPSTRRVLFKFESGNIVIQKKDIFGTAQSDPVPAEVLSGESEDFSVYVNIDHILDLFNDSVLHKVELRALVKKLNDKTFVVFRTVERVGYNADGTVAIDQKAEGVVPCTITRVVPSMT